MHQNKISKTLYRQIVLDSNPSPIGQNNAILVQFHFILSNKCIHSHYVDKQEVHEQ